MPVVRVLDDVSLDVATNDVDVQVVDVEEEDVLLVLVFDDEVHDGPEVGAMR